jgi:hypothetical protein
MLSHWLCHVIPLKPNPPHESAIPHPQSLRFYSWRLPDGDPSESSRLIELTTRVYLCSETKHMLQAVMSRRRCQHGRWVHNHCQRSLPRRSLDRGLGFRNASHRNETLMFMQCYRRRPTVDFPLHAIPIPFLLFEAEIPPSPLTRNRVFRVEHCEMRTL